MNNQTLILFGHKGAGKSFFGKLLAEILGLEFIDTDLTLEASYKEKTGRTLNCREIFLEVGVDAFRQMETAVVDGLDIEKDTVVAVGGGTILNIANYYKLQHMGKLVYLDASKELIKTRIFESGVPSFLDPKNLENSFEVMYESRKSTYEKIDAFKVKVDGKTNEEILDLLKKIREEISRIL